MMCCGDGQITTRVLGSLLKIPDENEKFTEFPSPESMKERIVISTKPPSEYLKGKKQSEALGKQANKAETVAQKLGLKKKNPSQKAKGKENFDWGDEVGGFEGTGPEDDDDDDDDADKDGQIDHVANPEYKKIIFIRAGKPKGSSLVSALAIDQNVKRVSLSEPQLEKVASKNPAALIE